MLSMLGIGIGVMALVVVLSIMDGFEGELKKRLMSSDLHILVRPTVAQADWADDRVGSFQKRHGEVARIFPIVSAEAMLRTGRKVKGVVAKGITTGQQERLRAVIVEWADPKLLKAGVPGIFVGQELAVEMRLIPGDQVSLVSPTETEGPMGNVPRMRRMQIEGVYRTGLADQELHTIFLPEAAVRSFLRKPSGWSQWEISLNSFDAAESVAASLRRDEPGLEVKDWRQLNAHLFASLRLERLAMFLVLVFIVIVASFNIITTLTLMVLEKTREISILKAMGATHKEVAGIFLWEGLLIGAVGVGGGLFAGFLICVFLARYPVIELPDVFYDRSLPVTFDLRYYTLIVLSATLIVLGACLYPSRRAARLNPLQGIRLG